MTIEILDLDVLHYITGFIKGDFIAWTSTCKFLAAFNTDKEKVSRANNYETIIFSGIPSLVPDEDQKARSLKGIIPRLRGYNTTAFWEYDGEEFDSSLDALFENPYIPFAELRRAEQYAVFRHNCIKRPGLTLAELHVILQDCSLSDLEDEKYMERLARHELITWDFIFVIWDFDWEFKILSSKPKKNLLFLLYNPDKDFDWEVVFSDKDIHLDFLQLILHTPGFTSRGIHKKIHTNPNLTLDFIKENPDIPWNSGNGIVKSDFISFTEMLETPRIKWNWKASIQNQVLPVELANQLIEAGHLCCSDFIGRQEFAWDYIKYFTTDWTLASERPDIMEIVLQDPENPLWNWKSISKSKHITLDFIAKFYSMNWDWNELSKLDIITWDFVSAFREKPWNPKEISRKSFVNWIVVTQNPWFPWCLTALWYNSYGKTPLSNTKRSRSGDKLTWF